MSSLDKLTVQGIRSFPPDQSNTVAFGSPLTVILGPNGSGKTTLIESLKYATTGEKPSGTGQGQSFIYDPKLCNDTTVRGQVRLEFTDVQNQHYRVIRSLEATQKAKKIEMKTLDNILSKNVGEKWASVTKKCADIDAEVVDALGVSKAILSNVIFCHQEDSCWPLDEGKKVKEKFDAIFNAERYMKCIKLHQDIRKNLQEKLGQIKVEIKHLTTRKADALNKRRRIAEDERQLAELNETVKQLESQMATLFDQRKDIRTILAEVEAVASELQNKKKDLENVRKAQQELLQGLDEEFTGTDAELEEKIRNFESDMDEKVASCKQLEVKSRTLAAQIESLQRKKGDLLVQVGELRSERSKYQQSRNRLFSDIREAAARYQLNVSLGPDDLTDQEVEEAMRQLSAKVKENKESLEKLKLEEEQKVTNQQSAIQNIRDEKTTLDSEIKSKESQSNELETKKASIKSRLDDLAISSGRMDRLERQLKETSEELAKKEGEIDVKNYEKEISILKEKLQTLVEVENRLDAEKSRLHEQSAARAHYDLLAKQFEDRKDKAKRLKLKHEDMLMNLFGGEVRDDDLKFQFESCLTKLSSEVQEQEKEINRGLMELESLKKERQMIEKQIGNKEDEIRSLKQKVNEVTRVETLESELVKVQSELAQQQAQKGLNDSLDTHYREFIKKLKQKKCCPLCHQNFPGESQVEELVDELEMKIRTVPAALKQINKKIEECRSRQEKLLTLRPAVEKIKDLEAKDLPELRTKLERLQKDIERLTSTTEEKEDSIAMAKSQEASAKTIQGEVVLLCQHIDEIKKMAVTLEKEKSRLGIGKHEVSRPLSVVSAEHEAAKRELQEVQAKTSAMQDRLNKYREEVGRITTKKNSLQEEKIKIGQGLQEKQSLEQQLSDIVKKANALEEEIEQKQKELPTLSRRLVAAENKLNELKKYRDKRVAEATDKLVALQETSVRLSDLSASVRAWTETGRDQKLLENEDLLESMQSRGQQLNEEKKKYEDLLLEARSRIDKHKVAERNLRDNVKLREKKVEEKRIKTECDRLAVKYRDYNYDELRTREENVERKLSKLNSDVQGNKGSATTLQNTIAKDKADYEKAYKNVEKEFKEIVFQERVHQHAIDDLNKNRVALEWAIAKFHEERMRIINKRVKELWRDIYKGTDIDYIMIRTDEIDAATAGTEKRRQHTYRVVMFKGSVELDMRGRCSAGQKMCASIIIRMALAETFSGSCGVLTLDEPTTNLDRENIESLCQALTSIADRHSGQKNFQLIVITHDEAFLDSICRTAYLQHYYKVKRDKNGNSQVRKVDFTHS